MGRTESSPSIGSPLALLVLGFILRLINAAGRSLNPDEALHYLLTRHETLGATYTASLAVNHPPLLIICLHYWGSIGHSELLLRLPSVLAGTAFCWMTFCWLRRVTDDSTALTCLAFLSLAPSLVLVSSEIRQYAFLFFFSATALYLLDRSIEEDSPVLMLSSAAVLCLALLSHFAALIVALSLGIYALLRFFSSTQLKRKLFLAWTGGQVAAGGVVIFLFLYNWPAMKARGAPQAVAASYLRRSVFWPGEDHLARFLVRNTIRLFHYFLGQAVVGVVALLLFALGLVLLIRAQKPPLARTPSGRQLAVLFALPLLVNAITGLLRAYPYGGSRHDSYLAMFAFPPVAFALSEWHPTRKWWKPAAISAAFAICYIFFHPQDEHISFAGQKRKLMTNAVAALHGLPREAIVFTDDQGGLLLSYYLCDAPVVQIEQRPYQPFMKARCGNHWIVSLDPALWIFKAETFPETLQRARQMYDLAPGTPLWFFQSGWFVDREFALREELKQYGCTSPQDFGRNMFLCRITVPNNLAALKEP